MPIQPNININSQFNTWYVPFLFSFPPHFGHTLNSSGLNLSFFFGFCDFGPGFLLLSISDKAFLTLPKSKCKVLAGTPALREASSILISFKAISTALTFSSLVRLLFAIYPPPTDIFANNYPFRRGFCL
ncbi:hypothetical protein ES703_107239 [subsurface metagenome]